MPTADQVRIRLCGSLGLEIEGEGLEERLPGRQGRQLFAFLVLNRGRSSSRGEIVEAIWGERQPANPDAGLATVLSRLRRVVGQERLPARDLPALELGDDPWIDVEVSVALEREALAALDAGRHEEAGVAAAAALTITAEPLLAGFDADWLDAERALLADRHLEMLAVATESSLALGRLAEAERTARELVDREPFRETNHARLMRVLRAQGNLGEALLAYERARAILREELGTSPGGELRELHAELLAEEAAEEAEAPARTTEASGRRGAADAGAASVGAGGAAIGHERGPAPALRLPPSVEQATRGPIVGRGADLVELDAAFGDSTGRPMFALVSGEPGIGKTRLVAEYAKRAHERGTTVLYGRTTEGNPLPYGAWIEALREAIDQVDEELLRGWAAGGADPRISMLIPSLTRRLGAPAAEPTGDMATDRLRLFDSILALLELLAERGPLLVCLEDLHWADTPAALGALTHALRYGRHPISFLATTRAGGLATGHPLANLVADLGREGQVRRLSLPGLGPEAIAELTAGLPGAGEELTERLYEETAGNAFFLQGILRAPRILDGVPDDVRGAVEQRVSALGPDGESMLRTASIFGRSFSFDALERLLEIGEDKLFNELTAAEEAGLVAEEAGAPGRFSFTHALIGTTLADSLGAARRLKLHRRAADVLRELEPYDPNATAAQIARHLLAGLSGDPSDAIEYSRRAAAEAASQLALEDAAEHLRHALDANERFGGADRDRRAAILLELADAENRAGNSARGEECALELVEIARVKDDGEMLARAALAYGGGGFGGVWWREFGAADETHISLLREAAEREDLDDGWRADVFGRLATELYFAGEGTERDRLSREAVELAERYGDPATLGYALSNRRIALWDPDHVEEWAPNDERMLELGREIGDAATEQMGHAWLVVDRMERCEVARVDEHIAAYRGFAERSGAPIDLWNLALFNGMRAAMERPVAEAERVFEYAYEVGKRVQPENARQGLRTQLFTPLALQGRTPELEEDVRRLVDEYPAVPAWRAGLANILLNAGHVDEAREVFDRLVAELDEIPRDVAWAAAMTWLANTCQLLADADAAERLYAAYSFRAEYVGVISFGLAITAPGHHDLGLLALTAGRIDDAESHFAESIEMCRRMGAVNFEAMSEIGMTMCLLTRGGEPAGVRTHAGRAGEIARANGLTLIEQLADAAQGATVGA
ncbi:AAA family ATPase [Thermoleophilia bacterium SCSIO 60948]|nr:AAA family ATPase [Thermoleophilia bacterium SCSIO 60948]